jgi:hypothetical protein
VLGIMGKAKGRISGKVRIYFLIPFISNFRLEKREKKDVYICIYIGTGCVKKHEKGGIPTSASIC